jgi:peptide alpha-N-acetyltransferase
MQVAADFAAAADSYVRRYLLRGIPSLFSDLKPLYADSAKAAALQQLFDSYAASLRSSGSLPALIRQANSTSSSNGPLQQQQPANGSSSSSSSSGEDNPLTWVLHYLAQHYDRLGDCEAALKLNAEALELAPGVIELLLARARILKHTGGLHLFSAVWCYGH